MQSYIFYGLAFAAVTLYSVQPIIAKKAQLTIPTFAFMAITMAILALLSLCASLFFERGFQLSQLTSSQITLLLLFGVVNFFSFTLFLKALSGIPAAHYQIIGGVSAPILTALFAYAFIGEQLATRFFLAIPLAFMTLVVALFWK